MFIAASVYKNAFPVINCRPTNQNAGEFVRFVGLDRKCFAVDLRVFHELVQFCRWIAVGVIRFCRNLKNRRIP